MNRRSKEMFDRTAQNQNHLNMGDLMDIYKTIKPGLQALTRGVPLSKEIYIGFLKHIFKPPVGTILSPSSTLWHRDYSFHDMRPRVYDADGNEKWSPGMHGCEHGATECTKEFDLVKSLDKLFLFLIRLNVYHPD